jgi:murein DD-endopeptidase MepM/ murein hydrolase activator NlpD
MQFIPASWARWGAGDPHNLRDAAAAAARLLCATGYASDRWTAIRRYNGAGPAARAYADRVTAYADQLDPTGPVGGAVPARDRSFIAAADRKAVEGWEALGGLAAGSPELGRAWRAVDDALFAAPGEATSAASPVASDARYVLPVDATAADLAASHHDYPAWDFPAAAGTPVRAVTGGVARRIVDSACGIGIVLDGDDGWRYVYCHLSTATLPVSGRVAAGDVVGLTGDTGNSTGPHLHFGVGTRAGQRVCPQPALQAWAEGRMVAPGPVTSGCTY